MAKYSSPTTRPTSPWRPSRPIFLQASELAEVATVLDIGCCRVTVHDHRLVLHQGSASLVVAPDALRLRIGGRAPEHSPEHLQRQVHPARLVDRCRSVSLHAWHEEHDEDALTSAAQKARLLAAFCCPLPWHDPINIDRSRRRRNSSASMPFGRRGVAVRSRPSEDAGILSVASTKQPSGSRPTRALERSSTRSHSRSCRFLGRSNAMMGGVKRVFTLWFYTCRCSGARPAPRDGGRS